MITILLLASVVVLLCVSCSKIFSGRLGIPALVIFIVLGMLFGSDGVVKIAFEDYSAAENICTVCLMFIMFYGGFGTKWSAAKPVAGRAVLLSTLGVVLTAAFTSIFCCLVLRMELLESMLIGAVISSTDAASVFSILRAKKLNLKGGLASLLEVESGSNDPFSYMLTVLVLSLMGSGGDGSIWGMLLAQLAFGTIFGVLIGLGAVFVLKRASLSEGMDTALVFAVVGLGYGLPAIMGGNGFLSLYIAGILMGNSQIPHKPALVHFFDGVTGLAQMLVFFLLGLLSFPSRLPNAIVPALAIALFLTAVSRPLAVFALMLPGKAPPEGRKLQIRKALFVSFAGLRGASSIVFAIMAVAAGTDTQNDIYHIVFCISLLSVLIQGTLLPMAARRLDLMDDGSSVLKTFNDYQNESEMQLIRITVAEGHPWAGKPINEIHFPPDSLVLMLKRDGETIIPKGSVVVQAGDLIILSTAVYRGEDDEVKLREITISSAHPWAGKTLRELGETVLPESILVVMIRRDGGTVIPKGRTVITPGDVMVVSDTAETAAVQ